MKIQGEVIQMIWRNKFIHWKHRMTKLELEGETSIKQNTLLQCYCIVKLTYVDGSEIINFAINYFQLLCALRCYVNRVGRTQMMELK